MRHVGGPVEIHADLLQTAIVEAQGACGVVGNVDDPAVHYWTPIIDTHHYGLAILQVRDLDECAHRQARVSGREIAHVERLSAGCRLALELHSIPGRGADLISPDFVTADFGLLVLRVLYLPVSTIVTGGGVTLAASRLLGPDAAPAPRLAIDKTTARPSAKRRRIQLPPKSRKVVFLGRMLLLSDDSTMLLREGLGVNQKKYCIH